MQLFDWQERGRKLFTVDRLAQEYGIHPQTLRAAARDGRLKVHFGEGAVFGRPLRLASRAAVDNFVRVHYRKRYSRFAAPLPPVETTTVPPNFFSKIIGLRLRLRLTQGEFARRIGAANKAVVYQWEARKRIPSVVFWRRIEQLASWYPSPSGDGRVASPLSLQQRGRRPSEANTSDEAQVAWEEHKRA
jgi:DNA-binding XRE family transcriptional regulator